jgi:hypothetical protein
MLESSLEKLSTELDESSLKLAQSHPRMWGVDAVMAIGFNFAIAHLTPEFARKSPISNSSFHSGIPYKMTITIQPLISTL